MCFTSLHLPLCNNQVLKYHQTNQGQETSAAFPGRRHATETPAPSFLSSSYASPPPDLLGTEWRKRQREREREQSKEEDEESGKRTEMQEQKSQWRDSEWVIKTSNDKDQNTKGKWHSTCCQACTFSTTTGFYICSSHSCRVNTRQTEWGQTWIQPERWRIETTAARQQNSRQFLQRMWLLGRVQWWAALTLQREWVRWRGELMSLGVDDRSPSTAEASEMMEGWREWHGLTRTAATKTRGRREKSCFLSQVFWAPKVPLDKKLYDKSPTKSLKLFAIISSC